MQVATWSWDQPEARSPWRWDQPGAGISLELGSTWSRPPHPRELSQNGKSWNVATEMKLRIAKAKRISHGCPMSPFWCHPRLRSGATKELQDGGGHQRGHRAGRASKEGTGVAGPARKAQGWQGHQGGHRTVTSRGRWDSSAFPIPVFPASLLGPPGRSPSSCRFLGLAPGSGKV